MQSVDIFTEEMRKHKLDQVVIDTFLQYYQQLVSGATGKLGREEIEAPGCQNIVNYEELPEGDTALLSKLAVIKLNGGLGTSMGLTKAKSLLRVKGADNFLDITAKQIIYIREKTGINIPLIFMDSFNTSADTLDYLKKYPELKLDYLPLDFQQNKFPKVREDKLHPLQTSNVSQNWNPPGHGDIYMSLVSTGILDILLSKGFEYIFVSNSDNLGAVVDKKILSYMKQKEVPFLMEVCPRTVLDKKGGHLAQTKAGQLVLREVAQCPEEEVEEFQNIELYKYFNTNNLWIDLKALKEELIRNNNVMLLPLILNKKKVEDVKVIQIETAMGAAISTFKGSKALVVERSRFAPVKKTTDLLAIWSDAYELTNDYRIVLTPPLTEAPTMDLDEKYYGLIDDLELRFAQGVPSLKECKKLKVRGNVFFQGEGIIFKDEVTINSINDPQ